MPRYFPIRRWRDEAPRQRALERLLALRARLREAVAGHRSDGSLLLATWNIRDFDSGKFGHGRRLPESFHYIAEIVAAFDLVAVQEVNRDLAGLAKLMDLLGGAWDYIVTDATEGRGGNDERMAFVYDARKVRFRRVAGEIVLPQGQRVVARRRMRDEGRVAGAGAGAGGGAAVEEDELQFARTPFMVAFQAGWFKFNLCTVHIYFGSASGEKLERRVREIRELARFFSKRQERETEDYILLGDFNIVSPEHETMKALEDEGFVVPENLKKEKTNLKGDKHYDQIALKVKEKRLEIGASGVFDFSSAVFRDNDDDFGAYFDAMPPDKRDGHDDGPRAYYADRWRTWQMSDHLPMWVELKVDFTDAYLESLKPGRTPLAD